MLSPFEKGRREQATGSLFDERPLPPKEVPAAPPQVRQCSACGAPFPPEHWRDNLDVCPGCGRHERIPARRRLEITIDPGTFEVLPLPQVIPDPLGFPDYARKLEKNREASGLPDALLMGVAAIGGHKAALGIMDPVFLMGSMGAAVGEGLSALSDEALKRKLPMVVFCCSGGARMQEGMVSLMQMAKVSLSVERLAAKKLPFITVLTDPTTGGVTASFASLGDVILAETDAYIGFTGMRVIKQTLRQELPEGFQKAEFMLDHGFIDIVLPRRDIPWTLGKILRLHGF
jgi:acetyl-CoA carboxylase carboxyl transferase beta subunit